MKLYCASDLILSWPKNGKLMTLVLVKCSRSVACSYQQSPVYRCVQYGVLPLEEAERLHQIVVERKRQLRLGGGVAAAALPTSGSKPKKKKARVIKEEGFHDPDMAVSGGEGIGRTVI
jgi:hypothetical protein